MGAYWPYFAYLDDNNEVAVVKNGPYSDTRLSPMDWTVASLGKAAMAGSKLAVVPLASSMASLYAAGGYGVFYQDTDGDLAYVQPNRDAAAANDTLVDSWPTGT